MAGAESGSGQGAPGATTGPDRTTGRHRGPNRNRPGGSRGPGRHSGAGTGPDNRRTDGERRSDTGGRRPDAQPAVAGGNQTLADRIKGFFSKDTQVDPHKVLREVSKGALLSGENSNPAESSRETRIRGREVLTHAAKKWAKEGPHRREIKAALRDRIEEYRDTHDGRAPSAEQARAFRIEVTHESRVAAGQRILDQIQDTENDTALQQRISEKQVARLMGGKELSGRAIRKMKTEAVVSELRGQPSREQQNQAPAPETDEAAKAKTEAMLKDDRFKDIRSQIKNEVLAELAKAGKTSIDQADNPAAVLKDIHDRAVARYAEAPGARAESAPNAADQALVDRAVATKQQLIDDETLNFMGGGMTYDEARAEAVKIAVTEIRNEDAKARRDADQAELDTALVDLRNTLSGDDITRLTERDDFYSVFEEELARYDDPSGRELSDAYDRTLGLLRQEEMDVEASIEQEAIDKGEVKRAKMKIIKEAGGVVPIDIDAQAIKAAKDVIRANREQAAKAAEARATGKAGAEASGTTTRAPEATAATAEGAEGRKVRTKALLRELGVNVKEKAIADILDTLKDPANAELKKEFKDNLARIQRVKAVADTEGIDFDAVAAVNKIIGGYKEQDGQTPNSEFAKKRFLKVLMEFLGAVAVELAKATVSTSVEGLKPTGS